MGGLRFWGGEIWGWGGLGGGSGGSPLRWWHPLVVVGGGGWWDFFWGGIFLGGGIWGGGRMWGSGGGLGGPHLSGLPRRLADDAAFLLRWRRGLQLPEEELCLRRLGGGTGWGGEGVMCGAGWGGGRCGVMWAEMGAWGDMGRGIRGEMREGMGGGGTITKGGHQRRGEPP